MPICSYVVYPTEGNQSKLEERLRGMDECEVDRAENRDLLLLVTDTSGLEHQKKLENELKSIDEIQSFAQTFGEIKPDEGEIPDDPKNHPT